MTIVVPAAVTAFKEKLAQVASQKRRAPKPAVKVEPRKPPSTAELLMEMRDVMKALLAELQSQRKSEPGPSAVKFVIDERDLDGRIKSFTVT